MLRFAGLAKVHRFVHKVQYKNYSLVNDIRRNVSIPRLNQVMFQESYRWENIHRIANAYHCSCQQLYGNGLITKLMRNDCVRESITI